MSDSLLWNDASALRFFAKVDRTLWGCWLWTGHRDGDGYGIFYMDGKSRKAHRVAFENFRETIPVGMTLDHVCRVRNCVNPEHVDVVSPGENTRRGNSITSRYAAATHCIWGHEFTPENTYRNNAGRTCRRCAIDRACAKAPCPECNKNLAKGGMRQHRRTQHGVA